MGRGGRGGRGGDLHIRMIDDDVRGGVVDCCFFLFICACGGGAG